MINHWDDQPEEWATIRVGETVWPGVWAVHVTTRRRIDQRLAKGLNQARLRDEGAEADAVKLSGRFLTSEHWQQLQQLIPTIHPRRPADSRGPVDVYHPVLALTGIDKLYVHEVEFPPLESGILRVEISAYRWEKEPAKSKKAKATGTPRENSLQPEWWVGPPPVLGNLVAVR